MCCSLTMRTWLQFPRTHILKKARCVSTHLQSWFREAEIKEFSSLSYVLQVRRETIPLVTVYWIVPQRLFSMFFLYHLPRSDITHPTHPGVAPPSLRWLLPHLSAGQSGGSIVSAEVPSSSMMSACAKLTWATASTIVTISTRYGWNPSRSYRARAMRVLLWI